MDEPKLICNPVIVIDVKADLLGIKSLCAVDIRNRNWNQFQLHLHR